MKNEPLAIAGIDYGSKMAGTTVLATLGASQSVDFFSAEAKKDADAFLLKHFKEQTPQAIFIDAPLSLPGKYRNLPNYEDYFYRRGDRELKAMSPMFLGGLTARAMRLCEQLQAQGHQVREIYPGGLARSLNLGEYHYKKQKSHLPTFLKHLASLLPFSFQANEVRTWHHVDALLALYSGLRFQGGIHDSFGDPTEGQIII